MRVEIKNKNIFFSDACSPCKAMLFITKTNQKPKERWNDYSSARHCRYKLNAQQMILPVFNFCFFRNQIFPNLKTCKYEKQKFKQSTKRSN